MKVSFRTISISSLLFFGLCSCESSNRDAAENAQTETELVEEIDHEIEFPDNHYGSLQREVSDLKKVDGFEAFEAIEPIPLISYLSGFYGGSHSHSSISYSPEESTFLVSEKSSQKTYTSDELEEALAKFRLLLTEKGDLPDAKMEEMETVNVDGEEMVYMEMSDLFPDDSEAKKHFTSEQYDFLYSEISASEGYAFAAGIESTHDFPLMYVSGYQETATINLITKDEAHSFSFAEVDSAFTTYRDLLQER